MRMVKFVLVVCMVALLAGAAMAEVAIVPIQRPLTIQGVISAVNLEKSAIVLGPVSPTAAAQPIIVMVNEKTRIVKNGKIVGPAALAAGDLCKVVALKTQEGALVALNVWAYAPPAPRLKFVNGVIAKIGYDTGIFAVKLPDTPTAPGAVITFIADSTTKVIKNGLPAAFTALTEGDLASVGFVPPPPTMTPVNNPIKAVTIEAKTPPQNIARIQGRLVGIDAANKVIAVQPLNSTTPISAATMKIRVTELTAIDKFGKKPFEALCLGDMVDVGYISNMDAAIPPAVTIMVQPLSYLGMVAKVDVINGALIAQQSPMGPAVLFKVVLETKILKNGLPATLKDLMPKDQVEIKFVHFREGNVAMIIVAKSPIMR